MTGVGVAEVTTMGDVCVPETGEGNGGAGWTLGGVGLVTMIWGGARQAEEGRGSGSSALAETGEKRRRRRS